jgi:hypothetical protein
MNARRVFTLSLLILLATASAAAAAPGTNKARGVYNRFGWESNGGSARHRYAQRAPATYHAPLVRSVESPQVAQAPVEARRFSYAPAPQGGVSVPCPPAPAVDNGRRYSYAPATEAAAAPQSTAPRVYYSRPSYGTRVRSGGQADLWALPKTDPRKFNSR